MALEAIFYDSFSKLDDRRFRLRIDPNSGNDDSTEPEGPPPLFVEILLPDGYPQVIPEFDINNLNNMKYSEAVKQGILEGLHPQALNQTRENVLQPCRMVEGKPTRILSSEESSCRS